MMSEDCAFVFASEQKYIHLAFSLCTLEVCECTLRMCTDSLRALISVHILGAVDVQFAIVNSGECHDERGLRICFCTVGAFISVHYFCVHFFFRVGVVLNLVLQAFAAVLG
jgi:hypothetical protein